MDGASGGLQTFAGLTLDRPRVMGVVNVTPDSFSDGGEGVDPGRAIEKGLRMLAEGADILDVGGESSRPGASDTPEDEEFNRVMPVIRGLAQQGALVSVDTRRPRVMAGALDAGARIVNDVSALRDYPESLPLVARAKAPVVLMHRRGVAQTRYDGPGYRDVVTDVANFLAERRDACIAAGLPAGEIVVDPGFGFGKAVEENLEFIRRMKELTAVGPVLIGLSRKAFVGRVTGVSDEKARLGGSLALALAAARAGAAIVRVHDVGATVQGLAADAALARQPGPAGAPQWVAYARPFRVA